MFSINSQSEPSSYQEACKNLKWVKALKNEIDILKQNKAWRLTGLPCGQKAIELKCVHKVKLNADRRVERYKIRFIAKDFTLKKDLDYHETFLSLTKIVYVRLLLL